MAGRDMFDDLFTDEPIDLLDEMEVFCDGCGEPIYGEPIIRLGLVVRDDEQEVTELCEDCDAGHD